jgi:hypothetical protein
LAVDGRDSRVSSRIVRPEIEGSSTVKVLRWTAAAVTLLMSLMNLPFAFDDGGANLAPALAWAVSLLGVVGIVAAIGLLRRARWALLAVLVVGVVNLVGAVIALAVAMEGAVIGLVVSGLIVVLALAVLVAERRPQLATTSASVPS